MRPSQFFNQEQKTQVTDAIQEAELNTSGEIRVHIESNCNEEVLDRAAFMFEKLAMHKTELRNGVLFYLSVNDRKFAILGDAGINKVAPDNFWDEINRNSYWSFQKRRICRRFKQWYKNGRKSIKRTFPISKK